MNVSILKRRLYKYMCCAIWHPLTASECSTVVVEINSPRFLSPCVGCNVTLRATYKHNSACCNNIVSRRKHAFAAHRTAAARQVNIT